MLTLTPKGLYCRAGDFYIDPSRAVERAVVTHAHSDHARRGSHQYFCVKSGEGLLRARIGKNIATQTFAYGEKFQMGEAAVSFHPAGHILGSSQVRIEYGGEVWVVSGDYKREYDSTCERFEVVPCDVFVTEATFGTPAYAWDKSADLGAEIFEWWSTNEAKGVNSVLFAYSLGKTQRVLGLLQPFAKRKILCHPAATVLNDCYRAEGVNMAATRCLSKVEASEVLRGELFLVPQGFLKSEQAELLGRNFQTAFASGWMASDHHGFDRGFLLSDHADWGDLVRTIQETRAKKVFVQHRGQGALVKYLNSNGVRAYPDSALIPRHPDQLELF